LQSRWGWGVTVKGHNLATVLESVARPREAIMDAAMHLFGKQGFTGTSMRDIAGAVGVLPGSLYAHISSKEALLVEIVEDGINRFLAAVRPHAESDATPADRLRAMVIAHVAVVADNPERSLVVFHQWRFLGTDNIQAAIGKRRDYEQAFIGVIEDGIQSGAFRSNLNRRIAVLTILGALNWTPEWLSPEGSLSPAEVGGMIADTLLTGVRG
jgi:TetR/AcrR family transcriptional regulator, cholesterol catabolism regulator